MTEEDEVVNYFNKLKTGVKVHSRQMSEISEIQSKINN